MGTSQESTSPTDSLRRVAIVLSSLPASVGADMLQSIDAQSRRHVQLAIENLTNVNLIERDEVLRKFSDQISEDKPIRAVGTQVAGEIQDEFEIGKDAVPSTTGSPIVNPQVAAVVSQWELPRTLDRERSSENRFAFLDDLDDDTTVQLLADEHAQTIALVFASITPKQAARVLPRLDPAVQSETIRRIGRLDDVPEATADEVAKLLRDRAAEIEQSKNTAGKTALQAIMDAMPDDFEDSSEFVDSVDSDDLHQGVTSDSPVNRDWIGPAEQATLPFVHDVAPQSSVASSTDEIHQYLLSLSPRQLCDSLGQVKTRDALLTLCGLPSELAEKTLALLPRTKAKQVRRSMATLGSLQIREIDQAKEAVAKASSANEPLAA